jgi:TPR repeat protein
MFWPAKIAPWHCELSVRRSQSWCATRLSAWPVNQDLANLYNQGVRMLIDFQQTGHRPAIDQAMTLLRRAADAFPAGHPRRGTVLSVLAGAYMTRFESFGDSADLEQAVTWGDQAVRTTPADSGDRPDVLTNVGMAYLTRYQGFGDTADLDKAISYCVEAAQQAGTSHPRCEFFLSNAGLTCREKFELTGDEADLTASIGYAKAAWRATPASDAGFASILANLAGAYQLRAARFGDTADLERAIEYWRHAERSSASRPDHVSMLSGLGLACRMRFEQTGADADLDEAMRNCTQALREGSETHVAFSTLLLNCAVTYKIRFDRFQDGADLEKARGHAQHAVDVTPEAHPQRAKYLSALAGIYMTLFQHTSRIGHLDRAIRSGREGLEATPLTHAGRAMNLSDLGLAYRIRFEQTRKPDDLLEAIRYGREAVRTTPSGHPEGAKRLSNLARAYLAQYKTTGAEKDLDRALRVGAKAVETTPGDHPDRAMHLSSLASIYHAQSQCGVPGSLDQAISCWREAVTSSVAPTNQRVNAAISWAIACETLEDPAPAAEGFAAAVRLLPVLAWRGLERNLREEHLANVGGLVTDAAAWAIEAGNLKKAVELLEQGRSVLWQQTLQLRSDLAELRAVNEHLSSRLMEVRAFLDRPRTEPELIQGEDVKADLSQEVIASRHRELARQWDDLIRQVRNIPGFETFLEPTPFSRLQKASAGGPVIVVNISNRRCDALIITAAGVRLRPLPALTAKECARWADTLLGTLYKIPPSAEAERALHLRRTQVLFATLRGLWDTVCGPVLKDLQDEGDLPPDQPAHAEAMPRLWWCPTGPLTVLPLHAAGHHAEPEGEHLSQVAVSSYTSTVEALLRSRERARTVARAQVLGVGMPTTPSVGDLQFRDLPAVPKELARLTEALPGGSVTTLRSPTREELSSGVLGQEETQPTRDRVMRALAWHSWAHFACHGGQNLMDPSRGALYLADGPLTVLQLAAGDLPDAELAFLSACQTAVGGVRLPDETIHLAAAVQLAGYRHVIATAWSINDRYAPEVAERTYADLITTGQLDASGAALAIHRAVDALREREPSRPDIWASYLHIGP